MSATVNRFIGKLLVALAYLLTLPMPILLPLAVFVYGQDVLLLSVVCIGIMLFAFGLIVLCSKREWKEGETPAGPRPFDPA